MKILISNPSKQYSHQTVKALMQKHTVIFATSFWHKPQNVIGKILRLFTSLRKELDKKTDSSIPVEYVYTHWSGILYKFFGRFLIKDVEQWSFMEDSIHDRWVSRKIRKWQPQLVIGYEKSCLKTFTVARSLGITTLLDVAQVHTGFIEMLRNVYPFFKTISGAENLFEKIHLRKKKEYNLANHIMVLSSFAQQTFIDNGIDADKISKVHLGFNPNQFQIKNFLINSEDVPLRLIFVGIVTLRKGIALLVEVMQELLPFPIELLIVGPRGDASYLVNTKSQYRNIQYLEYLSHSDLVKALQESDVLVMPSYLDSWAAVVVEAMACGLPVIVSDNTGAKDIVNDSNGIIISTGNKEQLKQAVLFYFNNRIEVNLMGQAAAEKAKQYSWINYYQEIDSVIQQLKK